MGALKSARVALTPRLAAGDVRATLRFGAAEVELQVIERQSRRAGASTASWCSSGWPRV